MNIGAHVSAAGGVYRCFENAERIGAECIQIFGASPRQWRVRQPSAEDVAKFKAEAKRSGVSPVFLHGAYLVNPASANAAARRLSIKNLTDHLQIAETLGANGLIFHLGSADDHNERAGVDRVVQAMQAALSAVRGKSLLIMENSAGGGHKVGDEIAELEYIFKKIKNKRVKICLDTAHAFEAGIMSFEKAALGQFFQDFDSRIGIENLAVIHANDSKTKSGSYHDRHENIGSGEIGLQGFRNLAGEKLIAKIPLILEVPGFADSGPDAKNIRILKSLFQKK